MQKRVPIQGVIFHNCCINLDLKITFVLQELQQQNTLLQIYKYDLKNSVFSLPLPVVIHNNYVG